MFTHEQCIGCKIWCGKKDGTYRTVPIMPWQSPTKITEHFWCHFCFELDLPGSTCLCNKCVVERAAIEADQRRRMDKRDIYSDG